MIPEEKPMLYVDIPLQDHDLMVQCVSEYLKYNQRRFHKKDEFDEELQDALVTTHTLVRGIIEFKATKVVSDTIPESQQFTLLRMTEAQILKSSLQYALKRSFLAEDSIPTTKSYLEVLNTAIKEFEVVLSHLESPESGF